MKSFALRNVRLYFRDRAAVLSSLLGVFIVIGLYALFLADNLENGYAAAGLAHSDWLVQAWLLAGVCAITPLTTALGSLGAVVQDRDAKINRDFNATPIASYKLVGGYLAGGLVSSMLLSLAALGAGAVWLAVCGVPFPGPAHMLALLGVLVLNALFSSCFMLFLAGLFHTNNGFMAASIVVGATSGFLAGIYLPIGLLPSAAQWIVRLFPCSHAAALLRYLLLQEPSAEIFAGLPDTVQPEIWLELGVRYEFGDTLFPLWGSVLILLAGALVFFLLSVFSYRQKR